MASMNTVLVCSLKVYFESVPSGLGDWGDQPIKENTKMIRQGFIHHNINKSNTKVITMKLS